MKTLRPKPGVIASHLARLPVFGGLAAPHRADLAAQSFLRLYDRGEPLFQRGARADALYCVVDGAVRVYRSGPDGREKVIHLLQAPALVAEVPVLTGARFPASAACTDPSTVLFLPRHALLELFGRDQELALRLLGAAMIRLQELTRSLVAHSQKSSAARVASYLLGLVHTQGAVVELPAAKKDVACYLGLQPESFSRALASLRKRGAIAVEDQRVRVLDLGALESLLSDS